MLTEFEVDLADSACFADWAEFVVLELAEELRTHSV